MAVCYRSTFTFEIPAQRRRVARVLLADSDLASRLALKTVLATAGYAVECAGSAREAVDRLDTAEYQLVLADLRAESEDSGAQLLAYARQKEFRPATALIFSQLSEIGAAIDYPQPGCESVVRMTDENVSYLLGRVADMISQRADRRMLRNAHRGAGFRSEVERNLS
jgi:CheY-like chemotaxis protein